MKKTLALALFSLLLGLVLPLLQADRPPAAPAEESAAPETVPEESPAPAAESVAAVPTTVRVLCADGSVADRALEDYLFGVVAGEMPATFALEALKAQAVAARSYTLYCAATGKHAAAGADVCTDPACCQAWCGEESLRERWGESYAENAEKIRGAVAATAGELLRYEGAPVFAAFHASSAGATEDCGQIWSPQPYLVSVSSPETAETVPNFVSRLDCAPLDFRDTLLSAAPEADFTGAPESWIGPIRRDESGRVAEAELGGVPFSGKELRRLFSLRSTAFTLEYAEGGFVFTVTGSGHGVGMSQYGANVMAAQGADYRQILAHYYPGTELAASSPSSAGSRA